jgi:hypothetical protein
MDQGVHSWHAQVGIAPLGADWLVSWGGDAATPLRYARIDLTGQILSPGIVTLLGSDAEGGMATCASPDLGFIVWRSGDGVGVHSVRLSMDGILLDPDLHLVSDFDSFNNWSLGIHRTLACAWTGEAFAVLWNNCWEENPAPEYPTYAQWVASEGSNLYPMPVKINQGSWPLETASTFLASRAVHVMADGGTPHYLHIVNTDSLGVVVAPSQQLRAATNDATAIGGLAARRAGECAVVGWGWGGEESGGAWSALSATLIDSEGTPGDCSSLLFASGTPQLDRFDVAAQGDAILVGYELEANPEHPAVYASLLPDRTWEVVPCGTQALEPTVCRMDSRYLMVWVEDHGDYPAIFKAILDPQEPGHEIQGELLCEMIGAGQRRPYLIPGPGQILCVFVTAMWGSPAYGHTYALRLGTDGMPLDPEPIPISMEPDYQRDPCGVWDGYNYVLTWTALDDAGSTWVTTGRLTPAGQRLDADGVVLAESPCVPARPAASNGGRVLVAYDENKLLRFWDAPGASTEVQGPASGRIWLSSPFPNPTRGTVRLVLDNPEPFPACVEILDVSGRRLLVLDCARPSQTRMLNWDGRRLRGAPVPAGVYYVRAAAGGLSVQRKIVVLR